MTARSKRNSDNVNATMRIKIPAIGFIITSMAACSTVQTMPPKPTKPSLEVVRMDSMVCFPSESASALAGYIIDLEAGYAD